MIEQYRSSATNQYTNHYQVPFNEPHYNASYYQEPLYDSTYLSFTTQMNKNSGRLGPPHVQFDLNSLIGQITVSAITYVINWQEDFC